MDDSLVAGLRARRPEALDELLSRYGAEIHAVAYLIVRDAADAEEVTFDTLLTAWQKIHGLREADRLRPWLLRIATRRALRIRTRQPRVVALTLDGTADPAESGAAMIDRLALAEAVDRLPPRMRAAVALHHVAGLTVAETAEALRSSPNTVKTQLREALARLRHELEHRP